jgi:hypothetical protein
MIVKMLRRWRLQRREKLVAKAAAMLSQSLLHRHRVRSSAQSLVGDQVQLLLQQLRVASLK